MAAPITNWVYDLHDTSTKDSKALEKAKAVDAKKMKNGWRWVNVGKTLKALVPYENGKPTRLAMDMIERRKQLLGIK